MKYTEDSIWHVEGFVEDRDILNKLNHYIFANNTNDLKQVFLLSDIDDASVVSVMEELQTTTLDFIRSEYISKHMERTIKHDLWSRELELIKWLDGSVLLPHYDGDSPEDALPPPQDTAKIASLIYLNDDYEGGEIGFPDYDIKISPKPGDLVIFPYFYIHEVHLVLPETSFGSRHTMPMFNSFVLE
jgi:hypothetical protein